jgi:hypothetical protein
VAILLPQLFCFLVGLCDGAGPSAEDVCSPRAASALIYCGKFKNQTVLSLFLMEFMI